LALIIYRKLETTNNDLQNVIDTLGNISVILEQQIESQAPDNKQEDIPLPENIPLPEDVGDLDLLLYENPEL